LFSWEHARKIFNRSSDPYCLEIHHLLHKYLFCRHHGRSQKRGSVEEISENFRDKKVQKDLLSVLHTTGCSDLFKMDWKCLRYRKNTNNCVATVLNLLYDDSDRNWFEKKKGEV